jgi:hypothetical protein
MSLKLFVIPSLLGTNTLAYDIHSYITTVKSFTALTLGPNVIKPFSGAIYEFS